MEPAQPLLLIPERIRFPEGIRRALSTYEIHAWVGRGRIGGAVTRGRWRAVLRSVPVTRLSGSGWRCSRGRRRIRGAGSTRQTIGSGLGCGDGPWRPRPGSCQFPGTGAPPLENSKVRSSSSITSSIFCRCSGQTNKWREKAQTVCIAQSVFWHPSSGS